MWNVRYQAAGGVVVDGDRVLVLRRPSRGEVRLPKGHIDPGETAEEAAVREVTEESGYTGLEVVADLGVDHAAFRKGGARINREERYFLMRLVDDAQIERHPHEYQFEPVWVSWDEALEQLTYPIEREWVRRARAALPDPR